MAPILWLSLVLKVCLEIVLRGRSPDYGSDCNAGFFVIVLVLGAAI